MHEILMKCITFFQLEYVYFVNIKKKKPTTIVIVSNLRPYEILNKTVCRF